MDAVNTKGAMYTQAFMDVGKGPTVILLHGLFGKVSMWKRTIESLKKNFRVIVPRLPIFDLPAEHANIRKLSYHLNDFIEYHHLDDVYLVGHGIGGQLALLYASEHPGVVNKIVVSGAELFQNGELAEILRREIPHDNSIVDEKVKSAFYNSYLAGPALVNEINSKIENESSRANIQSLVNWTYEDSVESLLNKLDHRVMLLWGLEDRITPPGVTFHFHDFLQNSEIRFIEKCGHLPMVEEPEVFARHLASFFG